jgi:hypothetical protein
LILYCAWHAEVHVSCAQHAPRETGEQVATPPIHRPIQTTPYAPSGEQTTTIKTFQFLDDGPWAKVYLPLENLASIAQSDVSADFQVRSVSVQIRGLRKETLEFKITKLHANIVPEDSFVKLMRTKVLIKMRKAAKPAKPVDDDASSDPSDVGAELVEPQLADARPVTEEEPETDTKPAEELDVLPAEASTAQGVQAAAEICKEAAETVEVAPSSKAKEYPHWFQLRAD